MQVKSPAITGQCGGLRKKFAFTLPNLPGG
jgi:hypothetical protein